MTLLDLILKEYIALVGFLETKENIVNDRIIIDKNYFKSLLEKNLYMKLSEKIRIYKALNLIVYDKTSNTYTMPYKDSESKRAVRKVIINYTAYKTLISLSNINYGG